MAPDLGKANVVKAEKALLSAISTTMTNNEPEIAKAIYDTGFKIFGSDFEGACEEKSEVLKKIKAKAQAPLKESNSVMKSILAAQDLLEQEMCVDEANKIGGLGEGLFTKEEYGKSRQAHLGKPVGSRND